MSRSLLTAVNLLVASLYPAVSSCSGGEPDWTAGCRSKVRLGQNEAAHARPNYDAIDHSRFDILLRRFVDCRGMVCYRAWKADHDAVAQLHDYLCYLGGVDTKSESASVAAKLAFYLNAYNALTIWGILLEYPTVSIQVHNRKGACYRIFDDLELWIDGEHLSLNRIENDVLRPLRESRIHFALVCAAKSCPRLRNEAYLACRLEQQLTDNGLDFFACRGRFRVCRLTGTVHLSPILKWYGKDFGNDEQAVVVAVLPFLPCEAREWLLGHACWKVKYLGYDWGLNDQCPTACVRLGGVGYSVYAKAEPRARLLARPFVKGK
ncbi:MAG: DUF547 domain-containing protein [Gemmataceae bacterium]|nr:DUF547 domain-containing protein [Gemmataceae bacterium]